MCEGDSHVFFVYGVARLSNMLGLSRPVGAIDSSPSLKSVIVREFSVRCLSQW